MYDKDRRRVQSVVSVIPPSRRGCVKLLLVSAVAVGLFLIVNALGGNGLVAFLIAVVAWYLMRAAT